MKILHLSDTHGSPRRLRSLPEGDLIVHSGDFTMTGSEQEALDFLNWFCALDYRHKIFICGNHDECLFGANITGLDDNVHYLCNTGIELEGIRFYGIPMFMADCETGRQDRHYAEIPFGTDVLITHAPPFGMLDRDHDRLYGSKALLSRVTLVKPRFHLFGHIHAGRGVVRTASTLFSNGAVMDADYVVLRTPEVLEW